MPTFIQGHLIIKWVNEGHVKIFFVRVTEAWLLYNRSSTEWSEFILLFELIHDLIQVFVANIALSISEQDARAQLLIGTSKGRERILVRASIGVREHQAFAWSLGKDGENHISKFGELDVFIMSNNMVQEITEFNIFESILNCIGNPWLEEFTDACDVAVILIVDGFSLCCFIFVSVFLLAFGLRCFASLVK